MCGTSPIEAEDHVLPWTGAVDATDQHHTTGQECRGAQALQGTTPVQHEAVGGEAGNEGPDAEPDQTEHVDWVAAVDVGEATEGKQEGRGHEGHGRSGPYCVGLRDGKLLQKGWDEYVEAGNKVLLHAEMSLVQIDPPEELQTDRTHGHELRGDYGIAKRGFGPYRLELSWSLSAETLNALPIRFLDIERPLRFHFILRCAIRLRTSRFES